MPNFHDDLCRALKIESTGKAELLNPLVLAYIGDTVFDLAVRTMLIQSQGGKVNSLHSKSAKRVRASAQAVAAKALFPRLSEAESKIYMRGRNAKPGTIPKNANPQDYAEATALETLLGYLFLDGQQDRMLELIVMALEAQQIDDSPAPRPFKGGRH